MKTDIRSNYSTEFKTQVVLESFCSHVSIKELALRYNLHSTTIYRWKKKLIKSAALIFQTPLAVSSQTKALKQLSQKKIALLEKLDRAMQQKEQVLEYYEQRVVSEIMIHHITLALQRYPKKHQSLFH